jgi:hypothetical protein
MAQASDPSVVAPRDYAATPASAYANLDATTCFAQLDERDVPYEHLNDVALVDAPVRITGTLHGVAFTHLRQAPAPAQPTDGSIVDCRLLLALDDFARSLEGRGITEIGYISAYRRDRTGRAKPGERHPAGLAIDVAWFGLKDGSRWDVGRDFGGKVGAKTCGGHARGPQPSSERATALRQLVCDVGRQRLFNLLLTPNYDRDHNDHVHLEVRRNIRWFLVH